MKVDFQTVVFKNNILNNICINQNYKKPDYPQNNRLSNIYYIPFGCGECSIDAKLESLEGIHCPSCGTKMLSKKEFEQIMKEAENIDSPREMIDFLNQHEEYINYKFKSTVKIFDTIYKNNPDLKLNDLLAITKGASNKKIANTMNNNIEYINSLIEDNSFSDRDRELLRQCNERVYRILDSRPRLSLTDYKDIVQNTVNKMDSERKWEINNKLKNSYNTAIIQKAVLNINDDEPGTGEYKIIKNILQNSVSKSVKINENNSFDPENNKILLCQACSKDKTYRLSRIINPTEKHVEIYRQHLREITENLVDNESPQVSVYLVRLSRAMERLSQGKLSVKGLRENSLIKQKIFESNKGIDFELTEIEGIPCACCGKSTITHNRKLELYDEISKLKTKKDYCNFFDKHNDIIRDRYIPLIQKFKKTLNENPDISDQDMVRILKEFEMSEINERLKECINYSKKISQKGNLSYRDKAKLREYRIKVRENFFQADYDREFDYPAYKEMIKETLEKMESSKRNNIINYLKSNVKNTYATQCVLYSPNYVLEKYDSPVEIFTQNIIKMSVSTKDHFVARMQNGKDEKDNLIVLCKDCNRQKSGAMVYNWLYRDNRAISNMQKYIDFVKDCVENGTIGPEYRQYLKNIQKNAYFHSKGQIEVSYNPEDFVV